jgi:hypothetical protein
MDASLVAATAGMPLWRDLAFYAFFLFAGAAILVSLLTMVWVPAVQLRRFSRTFAGRPELVAALNRVFRIYGWRARLAARLFRIPVPPGVATDR